MEQEPEPAKVAVTPAKKGQPAKTQPVKAAPASTSSSQSDAMRQQLFKYQAKARQTLRADNVKLQQRVAELEAKLAGSEEYNEAMDEMACLM